MKNRYILFLYNYYKSYIYSQKKVSRIMATSEKVATIIKFVTVKSLINQLYSRAYISLACILSILFCM